ncbi:uncharacterized protein IL334_002939 [Kwoniella shivajii]|uniref:SAP domain-containing protein n=1 Tax=Kwoniella shivajii TaxID=564305 RepID=A0ABZ1CW51_9TREE|nr:hypothetical protein IL334_002939 [Kwoniella shivajii]
MANTRPYTREELKGLRRANLQNLFKIHNLKGANGTNSVLIDSLVDYFSSQPYHTAHPSSEREKERSTISKSVNGGGKVESRYRNIPSNTSRPPVKGRVVSIPSAPIRRPTERKQTSAQNNTQAALKKSTTTATAIPERLTEDVIMDERIIEPIQSDSPLAPAPTQQEISITNQRSLPTPPASSSSHSSMSRNQVEALLSANDAKWQAKLEAQQEALVEMLERKLNEKTEKLLLEISQLRDQCNRLTTAGSSKTATNLESGSTRTWSPWEGRAVSQPISGPSNPYVHSLLGKRSSTHPEEDDNERSEAKRVRFNGSRLGAIDHSNESQPRTPSPQKSSAFGPDYFANPSLTPLPAQSSLIPRTPSPSRQGTAADHSQTPKLPNEWQGDGDVDVDVDGDEGSLSPSEDASEEQRTPMGGVGMIPHFSTTPEPPTRRPISPTMVMERSVSASSDRFTPGRMINTNSTPSNPTLTEERRRSEHMEGIPLSTVTDLERIDEIDETNNSNRKLISPNGQLNFPTIKPIPRLSGLGTPSKYQLPKSPAHHQHHQRVPSLLAAPLLVSRNSRAESELPTLRVPSTRGLSPPPRPRSANAIHGASTPPRTMFPLNLPEPDIGSERIRSASADYMHVAMHGLEDDLDFDDDSLLHPSSNAMATTTSLHNNQTSWLGTSTKQKQKQNELPTPGHRTLLGTERYNDKRFGDIPVSFPSSGIWESPNSRETLMPPTPF